MEYENFVKMIGRLGQGNVFCKTLANFFSWCGENYHLHPCLVTGTPTSIDAATDMRVLQPRIQLRNGAFVSFAALAGEGNDVVVLIYQPSSANENKCRSVLQYAQNQSSRCVATHIALSIILDDVKPQERVVAVCRESSNAVELYSLEQCRVPNWDITAQGSLHAMKDMIKAALETGTVFYGRNQYPHHQGVGIRL